jgi:predicted GNAT superfamily acetyltransferase
MAEPPLRTDLAERTLADAQASAHAAGVMIRSVSDLADLAQIVALYDRVWSNSGPPLLSLELLRALAHSGNYVAVAYDAATGSVLGASVGFFAAPVGRVLHSDVTGIDLSARNRNVGLSLKLHQRAWAIGHGLDEITWTFDPLVARNAYFNLRKIRARAVGYFVDFYGDMGDGINSGQGSDRLLCVWSLAGPEVVYACGPDPRPPEPRPSEAARILTSGPNGPQLHEVPAAAAEVLVAVPRDIEALRRADPEAARSWRLAVRETLGGEIAQGGRVIGFDAVDGYLVQRPTATEVGQP